MIKFIKKERGAFAVDAILGITLFLLSILSIMCVSIIIKIEAAMQYAVDQTAKELSSYYYLLDKIGVADITSGANSTDVNEKVKNSNQLISNVFDFATTTETTLDDIKDYKDVNWLDAGEIENALNTSQDDYNALKSSATEIGNTLKAIKDDGAGSQLKAILNVYARTMGNKALSYFVTPYLCRAIMPKYISGDTDSTNKYLESIGIEGGLDQMSFIYSSMLQDGRTINVDVIYKLNTKKLTFGMIDTDLTLHQTATTSAWIRPNSGGTLKTIGGAYQERNKKSTDSEQ